MSSGKFIVVEGIDGSGKTTVSRAVTERLILEGHDAVLTREPGGTKLAEDIRILSKDNRVRNTPFMALSIMYTARISHMLDLIIPLLNKGTTIICDRFSSSTFAYQTLEFSLLELIEQEFWKSIPESRKPDLEIYLNVDLKTAMSRLDESRAYTDKYEKQLDIVKARYKIRYLDESPSKISWPVSVLDATKDFEIVVDTVYRQVLGVINNEY